MPVQKDAAPDDRGEGPAPDEQNPGIEKDRGGGDDEQQDSPLGGADTLFPGHERLPEQHEAQGHRPEQAHRRHLPAPEGGDVQHQEVRRQEQIGMAGDPGGWGFEGKAFAIFRLLCQIFDTLIAKTTPRKRRILL